MKHSAQKLNALFQISKKAGTDFDLQEMLDFIIERAVKVFGAHTGSLMLIEKISRRLVMKSVIGLRANVVRTMKLKEGEGVTGQCALHGKAVLVSDARKDPYYVEAVAGTLSELAVPLIYQGKTFGVINLDSDRLSAFTKQDMKLLSAFASWAAMAIQLKMKENRKS
jgi:putative methionine-R-sulfoxide reductase with GAF domain